MSANNNMKSDSLNNNMKSIHTGLLCVSLGYHKLFDGIFFRK